MSHLKNKTVLVTGASKGIGEAIARHCAVQGANVILAARNKQTLDRIVTEIRTLGGQALAVQCDVSEYHQVNIAVAQAIKAYNRLDILINNAGLIEPIARLAESDPETWDFAIDVNVKGVYHGLRAAIPEMLKTDGGTIINISSGAANRALEGWSHYCSSKAAVLSLTRCADKEYSGQGIRVIGLSPGTVATDMQKSIRSSGINPVSQLDWDAHIPPEWVAKAVEYLCDKAGDEFLGKDFSLRDNEARKQMGLPQSAK
ncbi:NADP-dependent 3-hydroxy acid dehydrogenase YdfG [Desulfuromusa kysingii]|uniref:NADP-dependent 3-hydroxy acid dehydrogenase YdfG n=1 Tax=Desulfuromusa kysingii TaxID=37625 RepID=A0A1H3X5D8_9BACT|nr:SDR family oxidoreductase [Desulfuromusa kysingii]SDZ93748.1 NADP-dependent 3-hydroxy acid dehydrogenase YdfG [Desulfuromusa kysingii]